MPNSTIQNVLNNVTRVRSLNGGIVNQRAFTVAASTSIRPGDLVSLTTGEVVQMIALPGTDNTLSAVAGTDTVLGVALDSIDTNASGIDPERGDKTQIQVAIATDDLVVSLRIYDATAGDSEFQDLTVGSAYVIQRWRGDSADNSFYVLTDVTTNGNYRLMGLHEGQTDSDDYGWCDGIIVAARREMA